MTNLAELSEDRVDGELAAIYAAIRTGYGAPYVSSLQRHLATHPGVLEWAWQIVSPGFANGLIPETAWRLARDAGQQTSSIRPLDTDEIKALRLASADIAAIRNVCDNFIRVAPLNLLFAGCMRALLEGAPIPSANAPSSNTPWQPPAMLSTLPAMRPPEELSESQASDLAALSTTLGDQVFTPGLYRMLIHWPGYLSHVSRTVGPQLNTPAFHAQCDALADQIVNAVPKVLAQLPAPGALTPPDAALVPHLIQATMTYRRTSPQMVLIGSRLLAELPKAIN